MLGRIWVILKNASIKAFLAVDKRVEAVASVLTKWEIMHSKQFSKDQKEYILKKYYSK